MDAVADKERRRGKAGHNLNINFALQLVEEEIVALYTSLMKMTCQKTGAGLNKMRHGSNGRRRIDIRWDNI